MAGRARLQALKDEIHSRTLDYFDIDPVDVAVGTQQMPSHLDYVCAQVESGTSTTKLAKALSDSLGFDVSYERLMAYLRSEFGREGCDAALGDARSRASHCLAEQGLELVDAPAYDSVSVQQARARANQRNWMAERYNPSKYGGQKGVSVNVSIGSLHLDALRSLPSIVTTALPASIEASHDTTRNTTQVVDAEVLSIT